MLHRCEFKLLFHILLNGFMAGDKLGSAWLYILKSGFLIPPLQKHIIFFKYHIRKNKYSRLKLVVVWHSPIFVILPDPRTIPTDNYIRLRMLDANFFTEQRVYDNGFVDTKGARNLNIIYAFVKYDWKL